jgi:signal transduction histidine kinase
MTDFDSDEAPAPVTPDCGGGAKVLIVEDSPVQAELLRRALEGAEYQVIVARNGAEGLAAARASRPAAILSDVNMPIMDGYAMCRAIRDDAALKLTPVILLTMLSDTKDVIRGLNAGADAYVTKPYNIPTLIARIASLLAYPPAPPPANAQRKVKVQLDGETHLVDAHGPRMLNLLVSTYENAVLQNRELQATQQALDDVNRRLEARANELEAANSGLESFSYSVSHDLRAPIRGIEYAIQALGKNCEDRLDESGKACLREIRAGMGHMGQLIEDILQLSRVTRGAFEFRETDLTKIASEVAARLRKHEPGRRVECVIQQGLCAKADPGLLQQVFENLLGNAWKFTGGHASARIEVGSVAHEGKTAYFVRDDGAGFDMAYSDKLFTPFQRLHGQSAFPGTGIGLAIVKRIVQRHGGNIWAQSEVEHGATFYFTLS